MSSDDFSPNLALAYLLPNQAQKHVTVNDSLRALDVLVMAAVEAIGTDVPPDAPQAGQGWIIGADPSGAWSGQAGKLAVWQDGAWVYLTPRSGWRVWDRAQQVLNVFDGTQWQSVGGETQNLDYIGLATTADATNPLAVRLNKALFTAREGWDGGTGDLRLTLNKQAIGNTSSVLFQSGWGGRAEIGLAGNDDCSFRVSSDGWTWRDALKISADTGAVGIGGEVIDTVQLQVHGSLRASSGSGSVLLDNDGAIDLAHTSGGALYLRGRSAGSSLNFGVTDSGGILSSTLLSIRPDEADILSDLSFAPRVNAAVDLGKSGQIWRDIYVQNAPIIASDRRGKLDITDLKEVTDLIERLRPVSFRRTLDGPVHYGFIAQEVHESLLAIGQEDAALWSSSDPDCESGVQALRYDNLIAVLVSALQHISARVTALENGLGDVVCKP